ncbi:MAG: TRM11 family SAM-dependent methyltransferase [Gammaproteobacteria bacterium]
MRNSNGRTIGGVSDLPLARWREYGDLLTDSLWVLGDRDNSGRHDGFYHGNFIPQIPNQLMRRYTAAGDVVLDAFLGGGTTMIEARRLGRHSIGVELLPEIVKIAKRAAETQPVELIKSPNSDVFAETVVGDSGAEKTRDKVAAVLAKHGRENLDLIILHPPYHDIIQFSDRPEDLSNAENTDEFARRFGAVVANFSPMLRARRYLAVVIGDKYADGEWVPLGFRVMEETLRRDKTLSLKSIVVKNMINNRAKRNKENLWRYRALAGGFYVFRHEYILLFQKRTT